MKKCPNCKKSFFCAGDYSCWCHKMNISEENLKKIASCFDECLCEECLQKIKL